MQRDRFSNVHPWILLSIVRRMNKVLVPFRNRIEWLLQLLRTLSLHLFLSLLSENIWLCWSYVFLLQLYAKNYNLTFSSFSTYTNYAYLSDSFFYQLRNPNILIFLMIFGKVYFCILSYAYDLVLFIQNFLCEFNLRRFELLSFIKPRISALRWNDLLWLLNCGRCSVLR